MLESVLESVAAQNYQDFELIVGDDCSSDDTQVVLERKQTAQVRVVRHGVNLNLYGNLAVLFSEAQGEYVGILHDGDVLLPRALNQLVEYLDQHPSVGFVCCGYFVRDADDGGLCAPGIEEEALFPIDGVLGGHELIEVLGNRVSTPIAPSFSLWRKAIVNDAGGYRASWLLASDEDLYRRVALISQVGFCRERLFVMAERPPERRLVLGGWDGYYSLFSLRVDTIHKYDRCDLQEKRRRIRRLKRAYRALFLKGAIRSWLFGDSAAIAGLGDPTVINRLPAANMPFGFIFSSVLRTLEWLLTRTGRAGRLTGWVLGSGRGTRKSSGGREKQAMSRPEGRFRDDEGTSVVK